MSQYPAEIKIEKYDPESGMWAIESFDIHRR
jgi:hypothetical protein